MRDIEQPAAVQPADGPVRSAKVPLIQAQQFNEQLARVLAEQTAT